MRTRISALFDSCALFDFASLKGEKTPTRVAQPPMNAEHVEVSRLLWARLVTPPR